MTPATVQPKLTVRDLATDQGVAELAKQLSANLTPDQINQVKRAIAASLSKHPQLASIPVVGQKGLNNAFYNFAQNRVTTGLMNPDVLGHELGHAVNTQKSDAYQKLLLATRGISFLEQHAAIPVMLGLQAFVGAEKRKDILRTLAAASSANAAPQLNEELSASIEALLNSPDKLQAAKTLIPAFGSHALQKLWPTIAYTVAQRF